MIDSLIIVFGGAPDQLYQVTEGIAGSVAVSFFPMAHLLGNAEKLPSPGLVVLIQEDTFSTTVSFLEAIGKKWPDVPVIILAEDPKKEDIISAFRTGAKDYLLFPLQEGELRNAIQKHSRRAPALPAVEAWKGWSIKLKRWLGIEPPREEARLSAPAQKAKTAWIRFPQKKKLTPSREERIGQEAEARFFGNFSVKVGEREVPLLPGEKLNALFAYLLYHHEKPIHREILLSRFWAYTSPSSARKSLNVAVHTLRQHLQNYVPGLEFIQYFNDNYSINPELDISTDVGRFMHHWRKGRAVEAGQGPHAALVDYQEATALYQGDFMEGIHYEEWCEQERDNLKETYLALLDRLGTHFLKEEAFMPAEKVFRSMLDKDICLENAHRKLILCYYLLGRRDKAIRQYYKCADVLKKELNIEPSQSTKELFQLISADKRIYVSHFLI